MPENNPQMEKSHPTKQFNWRLSLCATAATIIVYLLFVLFGSADLGPLLFIALALVCSLAFLGKLAIAKGQRLSILSMMVTFWIVSAALVMTTIFVRDFARWTLWAKGYKATVLAQPASKGGELQHVLWDVWGWAGAETDVYVVFDPNDALAMATRTHPPGKLSVIPCEISGIRRLESHWYAATFYTDASWDRCT